MEFYPIPDEPVYREEIRRILPSDDTNADNALFAALAPIVESIAALSRRIDSLGGGGHPPFATNPATLTVGGESVEVDAITTTGNADIYALGLASSLARYSHGMLLFVRFHIANTTAAPTLNVGGLGPIPIRDASGNPLNAGDVGVSSTFLTQIFSTASGGFELRILRFVPSPLIFTDGLSNIFDVTLLATISTYSTGARYVVKFNAANTVGGERVINNFAPTIRMNIDEIGELPLTRNSLNPFVGEIPAGSVWVVETRVNAEIALIERVDDSHRYSMRSDLSAFTLVVTGIMTENGTMHLGFQPSCVIIMARRMTGRIGLGTSSTWLPWGNHIAMAVRGETGNQEREIGDSTVTITSDGFTTNSMFGSVLPHDSNSNRVSAAFPSTAAPLRYIAFR
jgi:hypothetical protein